MPSFEQMNLYGALAIIGTPLQLIIAIALFAHLLPLRKGWPRAVVGAFVFELFSILVMLILGSPVVGILGYELSQLLVFALILGASVLVVCSVFEASFWTALFCCTAGYTLQNIVSGATGLVWLLLGNDPGVLSHTITRVWIALACMGVIYPLAYFVFIRQIRSQGLARLENRRMLVMMPVVVGAIIGFDIVVKWLTESGIPLWSIVLLRAFHFIVCVFCVWIEYELLVNTQLEIQRATMEQVLSEHEHQYRQARGNINAINARMHDIRHAVARLANTDGIESEALKDIVREIAVYDSQANTGNEALDTALSERRFMLEAQGKVLTCMADGSALSFMAAADVYALFGSLLDAVAASDASSISLVVRESLGATSIHIETNGSAPDATQLEAARSIAARYKGAFSTLDGKSSFHVNVLFPAR